MTEFKPCLTYIKIKGFQCFNTAEITSQFNDIMQFQPY